MGHARLSARLAIRDDARRRLLVLRGPPPHDRAPRARARRQRQGRRARARLLPRLLQRCRQFPALHAALHRLGQPRALAAAPARTGGRCAHRRGGHSFRPPHPRSPAVRRQRRAAASARADSRAARQRHRWHAVHAAPVVQHVAGRWRGAAARHARHAQAAARGADGAQRPRRCHSRCGRPSSA